MNRSRDRPSPLAWASHISAHTNYGCTSWNLRRGALLIIAVATTAKGTHVRVLSCTALYSPTAQACKSGRRLCGLRMALARSRLHKVRENAFNSLSTCTKDGVGRPELLLDGIARVDMENITGPASPRLDKGRRDAAIGHVGGAPDAKAVCPRFVHRHRDSAQAQACDTLDAWQIRLAYLAW
eukprot:scaffold2212_cov134-Isochrysis_galbana.AAC.2